MEQSLTKKVKLLALMFLIFSTLILALTSLPKAEALTTIISLDPSSGRVGTTVHLVADIDNASDTFQVMFDDLNITGVTATGNRINASFVVPDAAVGLHNVTVTDTTTGGNDTETFTVATTYYLDIPKIDAPGQRQEGDSVPINVTITGAESNTTYVANVTVVIPYNTVNNASSTAMLNIVTSLTGRGAVITNYSENFPQANTSLVGTYRVSLNSTFGVGSFTIGLTNSTEYHRDQTVDVKALYQPGENVTLAITGKNIDPHIANLTADNSTGMVHYTSWPVPSDASMGTYTVNITSQGSTVKNPIDIQSFSVPGYAVNVTTRNLALEPVESVNVTAFENGNAISNQTSGSDGVAPLRLEFGNYTYEARYKDAIVSEGWLNVTSTAPRDMTCNLTNLRVVVLASVDGSEIQIPEAGTSLTRADALQTLENQNVTDINGTAVIHSLLPDISYVLNVSRYGMQFNTTNIPALRVSGSLTDWFTVPVICPTFTLQVNITDASGRAASDVLVKVQETMGGILYGNRTDAEGMAIFNSVFGKYQITAYDSHGVKLTEVVADLFQDQNVLLPCPLYGLTATIRIVDYFGQPISNANVTLRREGEMSNSTLTKGDGNAVFSGLTGGNLQVVVYLLDQTQSFKESMYSIINSTTIEIRADKYVMFAGFFVETSQLATVLIIVATVLFVVAIEVYRRGRLKPKKGET